METDFEPNVLVQGITGKEGSRGVVQMRDYGTSVLCGVTPGKGGQDVEGIPVFNSVQEAKKEFAQVNTSVIYVPPLFVKNAALEAMEAGITTLLIFTENIPIQDVMSICETAKEKGVEIIGPASVGALKVGSWKLGSIGGADAKDAFISGPVSILSKSGGMTKETALLFSKAGIGQSYVFGLGGDVIAGTTFSDVAKLCEQDTNTKVIVVFGEVGGAYEEQLAQAVQEGSITKPIVAYISGDFIELFGRELAFGHAGAIIEDGKDSAKEKRKVLESAGIHIVKYHHELLEKVQELLK